MKYFIFSIIISLTNFLNELKAQKVWLSGTHHNASIEYIENGSKQTNLAVWTGGKPKNGKIVVFGSFKIDEKGLNYFDIEKSEKQVVLKEGTFEKKNFSCSVSGGFEGTITSIDGHKTDVLAYRSIKNGEFVKVTSADWGTKNCDGNVISVYYINSFLTTNTDNSSHHAALTIKETGSSLTLKEAQNALNFHNQIRKDYEIPPLTWSTELSKIAQDYANTLANSGCSLTHSNSNFGENLFAGSGKVYTSLDASKAWYNEIKDFKYEPYGNSNDNTGHFTQMIWKDTTELGMGVSKCSKNTYIIVANYNPPGNYLGEYPF